MLDQNTDRMWFVIGALVVGAGIILLANKAMPELFASVGDSFKGATDKVTNTINNAMINNDTEKELEGKEIVTVTDGLLLQYDFTEGNGDQAIDQSGHGKDARLIGFDHTATSGWTDAGLLFDGENDYVVGPSALAFPDETITMQARVRFSGLDYENKEGKLLTLLKKGHPDKLSPHAGFALSYDNRANRQDFSYTAFGNPEGGYNGGGNSFDSRTSTIQLENDHMYTLTVTVNANAVGRIFIDGQLMFERQFANDVHLNNNAELFIGKWSDRYIYNVGMTLESIHIYDRALEPIEVLMNHVVASGGV